MDLEAFAKTAETAIARSGLHFCHFLSSNLLFNKAIHFLKEKVSRESFFSPHNNPKLAPDSDPKIL
jgi:hypothetical protein